MPWGFGWNLSSPPSNAEGSVGMDSLASIFESLSLGSRHTDSAFSPSASTSRRNPEDFPFEDETHIERSISCRIDRPRRSSPDGVVRCILSPPAERTSRRRVTEPPRADSPESNITAPPRMQKSQSAPAPRRALSTTVQCSGKTRMGKRCKQRISVPLVLVEDSDSEEETNIYCGTHKKMIAQAAAFSASTAMGQKTVIAEEWLEQFLNTKTKTRLKEVMHRRLSASDEPGYLYCLEIRGLDPDFYHFKVGRAVNLASRIRDWNNKCTSNVQILRSYWPGGLDSNTTSFLPANLGGAPKGPNCHLAERLIHILLEFQAEYAPYLQPGYPNIDGDSLSLRYPARREPCLSPPCKGKMYKEIFSFKHIKHGPNVGREFELVVLPALEWVGNFMLVYHGELAYDSDE